MSDKPPFDRTNFIDKPGIVGARWWHDSLSAAGDATGRRDALRMLLLVGGGVAAAGMGLATCVAVTASSSGPETREEKRGALDMQREYGWSFAAEHEPLTFDGTSTAPFDRSALLRMPTDLDPAQGQLKPYYTRTLFQSPSSVPQKRLPDTTTVFKPLSEVLVPISTNATRAAYLRGRALASLFEGGPNDRAVIVDLPGPEAVAFAAGAASRFDPVFTFDNWPHPYGVVKSHLTLASAAYYQPLFARVSSSRRPPSPALFVLDRDRLAPYSESAADFDNRYVARLPSDANMKQLGVQHVLYVTPSSSIFQELDDINDDLVGYKNAGIEVRMLAATDLSADSSASSSPPAGTSPEDWPPYYYGGSPDTHYWFWKNYPWNPPPRPAKAAPNGVSSGYAWAPVKRNTMFSSTTGQSGGMNKTRPAALGLVPVAIAIGTGVLLGPSFSRSGSFGRSWGGSGSLPMSELSIFALEVAARIQPGSPFRQRLHQLIVSQPARATFGHKTELYRNVVDTLIAGSSSFELGCWDFFDNTERALKDFKMWTDGMTTEEGARTSPSVTGNPGDPYRQSSQPLYMTFTMAFLLARFSPTERQIAARCNIPQQNLWRKDVFNYLIQGVKMINFASVQADVIYLIPGDDTWSLTEQDLQQPKFHYLRRLQ